MHSYRLTPLLSIFLGVLLVGATVAVVILHLWPKPVVQSFDPLVQSLLKTIPEIHTYRQEVETSANLADRDLKIVGTYLLDMQHNTYSSFSTTTVAVRGKSLRTSKLSFSVQNISINNEMYTRVVTRPSEDNLIKTAVPSNSHWQHFKSNAIPPEFMNIATSGPILDNVKIFSENGKYILQVSADGIEKFGDESLMRYTFKLSGVFPDGGDGTLRELLQRIGPEGTIVAWIDGSGGNIRRMNFHNASYQSTTTISDINLPLTISPPLPRVI